MGVSFVERGWGLLESRRQEFRWWEGVRTQQEPQVCSVRRRR